MEKLIIIAETRHEAAQSARDRGLASNEYIYINDTMGDKLQGLELSWRDVAVVGDPRLRFSFFQLLLTRIRNPQ